jgi:hypothetical protein
MIGGPAQAHDCNGSPVQGVNCPKFAQFSSEPRLSHAPVLNLDSGRAGRIYFFNPLGFRPETVGMRCSVAELDPGAGVRTASTPDIPKTMPPGFNPDGVITAKASLDDVRYRDPASLRKLLDRSLAAMREVPGVRNGAVGLTAPFERSLLTASGYRRQAGRPRVGDFWQFNGRSPLTAEIPDQTGHCPSVNWRRASLRGGTRFIAPRARHRQPIRPTQTRPAQESRTAGWKKTSSTRGARGGQWHSISITQPYTYLQVVTWQTAALQNERNDIDIMRRRLEADVLLIKALGGGWDVSKLPKLTS